MFRFPSRWSGISTRITIAAAALTLTSVVSLGGLSFVVTRALVRHNMLHSLERTTDNIRLRQERLLEALKDDAASLASNPLVKASLSDTGVRDRYLVPFLKHHQLPEGVDGTVVLCGSAGSVLAADTPLPAHAHCDQPDLRTAVLGGNHFSTLLHRDGRRTLLLAYPVEAAGRGTVRGMLLYETFLDDLFGRPVRAETAESAFSVSILRGAEVLWSRSSAAGKAATISRPLRFADPPLRDLSLTLVVSDAPGGLFGPQEAVAVAYLAAGIVILLLTLAVARAMARRIVAPLRDLTGTANRVAAGGPLDLPLPPAGADEVSMLAGAFTTMVSRLREATERLEDRVEERTRDLGQAHESLLAEKIFSDTVIDSLPGVFYVYDEEGRLLRWNRNNERVTGYSAGELAGIHAGLLVPPEEREPLAAKMREVFTAGYAETEVTIVSKTGRRMPHFVTGVRAEIGGRPLLIGTGIDITGLRSAEMKLRELDRQQKALLDNIPDLAWLKDAESRLVAVNRPYADSCGVQPEDLVGKTDLDIWPAELAERYRSDDAAVMASRVRKQVEEPLKDKEGGLRWIETIKTPIFDDGGAVIGTAGIARDITERKRAEQELQESEERYRILADLSPDMIGIHQDGKFIYINRSGVALLGGSNPEQVLNTPVMQFVHPDCRTVVQERIRRSIELGVLNPFLEEKLRRLDGADVDVEVAGVAFLHRERPATVVVVRDITERKRNERALEELNRTLRQRVDAEVARNLEKDRMLMVQSRHAAMGEMLGNIAHQWRQPLNAIGLIIQDIQDAQANGVLTPPYLGQSVQRAMEVIRHLSQTIDDFRTLHRTEKKPKVFSVNEIIERTVALVRAGFHHHQIAISTDLGEPVTLEGHPNDLSQVLLNLLINARDVLVERAVPDPLVTVRLGRESGRVVVTVADNGGGIPVDILDRIFEPYFTTKEEGKGTGIGLYLSRTLVEKNMGGSLSARNGTAGAEFRITL